MVGRKKKIVDEGERLFKIKKNALGEAMKEMSSQNLQKVLNLINFYHLYLLDAIAMRLGTLVSGILVLIALPVILLVALLMYSLMVVGWMSILLSPVANLFSDGKNHIQNYFRTKK